MHGAYGLLLHCAHNLMAFSTNVQQRKVLEMWPPCMDTPQWWSHIVVYGATPCEVPMQVPPRYLSSTLLQWCCLGDRLYNSYIPTWGGGLAHCDTNVQDHTPGRDVTSTGIFSVLSVTTFCMTLFYSPFVPSALPLCFPTNNSFLTSILSDQEGQFLVPVVSNSTQNKSLILKTSCK